MKKIRVGILFGGKSAEHEVSLQSARNIIEAIDKNKYEIVLIGIDKQGRWQLSQSSHYLRNANNPKLIKLNKAGEAVAILPGESTNQLMALETKPARTSLDVIFPVLHGPFGEDGTVQGMLRLAGIPFVGASVLGSAVGMDKDVMKRLLRDAGLAIARFVTVHRPFRNKLDFDRLAEQLGLPLFVKPANLGSSVGISKVSSQEAFQRAADLAFEYDNKIIIEETILGREIEVSVLGNEDPIASVPGEIIPKRDFYSYEAKYIDENGAILDVPAKLPGEKVTEFQQLAIQVFRVLSCEGLARVDFFLKEDGTIVVNELNTIPGFTKISMYPRLWEASGIPYSELIDRLIQLAIERFEREQSLKISYES